MKKLVILPSKSSKYSEIINSIKNLPLKKVNFMDVKNINLTKVKKFDVVIFEKISERLLKQINKLKIVTIKINKHIRYNKLIDISIDPYFKITMKNNTNPTKGNFRPIQLDISNTNDFVYLLNIITIMDWDSKFWKKKICFIGPKRLTESIIFRCKKFIRKNKIEMIQFLSNCHESESVKIAEKNNFGFKDIRITLEKKVDKIDKNIKFTKNISLRKAKLADFKFIKPIARDSYLDSRYYFDEFFSVNRVKNFYEGWLKKAILGTFDDLCLLICYKNKPVGFCTIKIRTPNAIIGLFSISSKHQGKGFSKILLKYLNYEMNKKNIKNITVVTQGRNYSALKAYQNVNFKITRTELWYHKWIAGNKKKLVNY